VFVIARRAKPSVAIQPFIDSIDDLDCFASFAMRILAGVLSFSAACQALPSPRIAPGFYATRAGRAKNYEKTSDYFNLKTPT
jgi:hypothetical protein